MKNKIILFSLGLFLMTSMSFAQNGKKPPQSIIDKKVGVKYHEKAELERMNKGQMLDLYIERIESLVQLLPYIAFATKPGVTMVDLGIPTTKDNTEALEEKYESTNSFLLTNRQFQKKLLPYSDKGDLISAILFYEEVMKQLHSYAEFH